MENEQWDLSSGILLTIFYQIFNFIEKTFPEIKPSQLVQLVFNKTLTKKYKKTIIVSSYLIYSILIFRTGEKNEKNCLVKYTGKKHEY